VTVVESIDDLDIRVPTAEQILRGACGTRPLDTPGIVLGTVTMRGEPTPPRGVRVVAEWTEVSIRSAQGAPPVDKQTTWLEARVDTLGTFRLCGVPVNTTLTIRAESDSAGGAPVDARIAPQSRLARAELTLDRIASRAAVLVGSVVTDSTQRPVASAEISLPDLSKGVISGDDGTFRLPDIPPGTHRVHVRRIGYGPLDTVIAFRPNQTVDRRIVLRNVVALDSVRVTAEALTFPGFEEHRKMGLGTFLTREQLASRDNSKLAEVLSELPSVTVHRGSRSTAAVASRRRAPSLQPRGERIDTLPGIAATCLAKVWVDGHLMNPGGTAEPFDINTISPQQIEAIEWYEGPAQTPQRYSNLNTVCGVLVIWTRR
jgi:hypothetical protein